ncbi:MAG TPA: outer membrane beta-barrel protein, partial [Burkholderiales bacterium]|nr:outer membrane beta-barrel protein [Burkholderiales bacterium]
LLFVSTAASAQLYLFAGAGGGTLRLKSDDLVTAGLDTFVSRREDNKDVTYQLGVGWRFNPYWAVEIAGADMGDYSIDIEDIATNRLVATHEVKGFKTAVLGIWPLTERFSAFAKLGIASTKATVSGTLNGTPFSANEKRNSPLAGFGVQWMFWKNIGVRAEYENWGEVGNETDTGRGKLDTLNLQAVFSF